MFVRCMGWWWEETKTEVVELEQENGRWVLAGCWLEAGLEEGWGQSWMIAGTARGLEMR